MEDQQVLTPPVPPKLAHLMDEPEFAEAWDHQVAARRAEAGKITAILDYKKRLIGEYHQVPQALVCEVERAAVRDAALLLGVSEMTTLIMLDAATVARDFLPATWAAFQQGRIDMLRVRKIVTATEELDDEMLPEVDARVADEAAARGLADFHRWLNRYIAQVDFEAYQAVCASRRRDRYVRFTHFGDGTSYLQARLPTIEAAAIEKRLSITARRHHHTHPGQDDHAGQADHTGRVDYARPADGASPVDDRTLVQREVDLLSAWLRTGDTPDEGAAPVEAKIMIMIPEPTLTGETEEPAMAADRSWMLDAHQARALVADPEVNHEWYDGHTRPDPAEADVDVLSVTYTGRYPPARLREAIILRDGVCQATGCTIPAERCDLDHQIPWEAGGATTAANLWALCRRHHRLKSHGLLTPPTPPPRHPTPT